MQLSPRLYSWIIRPKFAVKKYIQKPLSENVEIGNKKILDFGCGTGSNAFIFNTGEYHGVDVDCARISLAKEYFPRLDFKCYTDNLAFPDNYFDYIFIIATIHHISDSDFGTILPELKRVLSSRGKIFILEPFLKPGDRFRNWFMNFFDAGKYIRKEAGYVKIINSDFRVRKLKEFSKFFLYNEILLVAEPNIN